MAVRRVLASLQPHNGKAAPCNGDPTAGFGDNPRTATDGAGPSAPGGGSSGSAVGGDNFLWQVQPSNGMNGKDGTYTAAAADSLDRSSFAGQLGWLRRTTGCHFWQEFSACVYVMCLSEIKYALMAQSVVGVPGVMTLLCNLSTTVNLGTDTEEIEKASTATAHTATASQFVPNPHAPCCATALALAVLFHFHGVSGYKLHSWHVGQQEITVVHLLVVERLPALCMISS